VLPRNWNTHKSAEFASWQRQWLGVTSFYPVITAAVAFLASYDLLRSLLLGVAILALQTTGSALLGIQGIFSDELVRNTFALLVGAVLLVELDQACLAILGRGIPLGMVVVLSFLRVAWTSTRRATALPQENHPLFPWILILYLSAVLFSAGRQHHWLTLVAVSLVPIFLISRKRPVDSWISMTCFLLSLITLAFAVRMRPSYTPLVTEEQVFYELLANSLSHFPASQPSYSTTSGINYHWLANGLAGWLNREIGFQPFILSSLVLPIVFGLMTIYLVTLLTRMGSRPLRSHIVVATVAGLFGFRIYAGNTVGALNTFNSSQELLMMALAIGLLVTLSNDSTAGSIRNVMVCALLAYGCVGAGASAVITFIPGSLTFTLARVITGPKGRTRRDQLLLFISIAASAALALWRFHGYPNPSFSGGARVSVLPIFGFVGQLVGDLDLLPPDQQTIARTLFVLGVSAVPLSALLIPRVAEEPRRGSIIDHVLFSALLGLTFTQYGAYGINLRILTTALILAVFVLSLRVAESFARLNSLLWPLATAVLVWVVWYWLVNTKQAGDVRSVQIRAFLSATPALLLFAYFLGYVIATRFRDSRRVQRSENQGILSTSAWHAAAAALLTFGCLQGISTSLEAYEYYQPRLSNRAEALNASVETRDTAEWLADQPSAGLVVVDVPSGGLQLQNLIALSSRQFLILGASLWDKDFLKDADAAYKLQLQRQLSSPSKPLLQQLAISGVSHLVIERDISKRRISALLGQPQFENPVYSVFQLPSDVNSERSD